MQKGLHDLEQANNILSLFWPDDIIIMPGILVPIFTSIADSLSF